MPTKINQGMMASALAAEAIAANLLVQRSTTAGSVGLCGASGLPAGATQEAFANAAQCTFYRPFGSALVTASAAIAAGDFVKAAASGKVAPEATVTTRTAATIGIAITAASGDGVTFEMEWI